MINKVYFENMSDAIKMSKNLDTTLDETLSIEVDDVDEIRVAANQEGISSKKYSIAQIDEATKD